MRKLALAILLSTFASPVWATTYYLATAAGRGSDSNTGISPSTPWLTPNHAINCGDVILAAASTSYSEVNFNQGHWGTVSCSESPNVAWLKCVTFDACKVTSSGGNPGFYVDHSYWGIQGWEITITANTYAGCFLGAPNSSTQISVHHIIFANNICNGGYAGGIGCGISGTGSADYCAIIGNIAYNAAAGTYCYSNIDIYEPLNYDSLPGTHIYIGGNFSFGALNTPNCNGGFPASDGEGINIDTLDGSQGAPAPYTQQVLVDNNIVLSNGGRGIEVENNTKCTSCANVYIRHNTSWGNSTDTSQSGGYCGEMQINTAYNIQSYYNLSVPSAATSCGTNRIYAFQVTGNATTSDRVYNNWGYSPFGNNSDIVSSSGFVFGPNNNFGTNPSFASPVAPSTPSCGSFASVPACMATVIANFRPTNTSAASYGYQIPSTVQTYDPLFPQWLCKVSLPPGLVTMGCLTASSLPASPTITGVKVQ